MSAWGKVKLGDVSILKRGRYVTRSSVRSGNIPVILGGQEPAYYCDQANHTGPCFVISRSGASAGFVSYWNEPIFVTDGFLFEATARASIQYLYYHLKSRQAFLGHMQNGTGIPHVRGEDLKRLEIDLPPLATQQRIAAILSDYDSAIANCRRQIALLEEAAQRLYRESFAEGKGEKKTIEEICDTTGGGTPSTSHPEYWDGDVPWVVPTDITKNSCLTLLSTEKKITKLGLAKSSAKMLPPKAILMTSRASVGYFGVADFPVCTNQGFISVVPHDENMRWYLLFNLMARVDEIRAKAKGATFAEISKSSFRAMIVTVPNQAKLVSFDKSVSLTMEQELVLSRQIRALTEARDRLLPKLMSGEVAA